MSAKSSERTPSIIDAAPEAIAEAAEACADAVERGDLIVFPTDTVYGIGADPFSEAAILRLFEAKGRPQGMPIPVLVASAAEVGCVSEGELPAVAAELFERFWPGALTVIVPRSEALPAVIASGGDTIGLRLPDSEIALEIIAACGGALATTSANLTAQPPAREVGELSPELLAHVAVVIDGGPCRGGTASTVLDLTADPPKILREGPVSREELREVIPSLA